MVQVHAISRRTLLQGAGAAVAALPRCAPARAQTAAPEFSYPMGVPGRPLGDGFVIRIAYAAENARYYPGWWHTGENWRRAEGETAGLGVYAVADGEVIFAGSEYPGLVVIVQHANSLYSMYGHLDYALAAEPGQTVARGDILGTVLARADDYARGHLHFELRTFFIRDSINGTAPQYGVSCGYACPPGPGYWPMAAPEHPSDLGWRNPTHVINRRAWPDGVPDGAEVTVASTAPERVPVWNAPSDLEGAEQTGELALAAGQHYPLLTVATGAEAATETSAAATWLWYQIGLPDGTSGWVQAAVPVAAHSGAAGRPSSVRLDVLPAVVTPHP